MDEIDIRAYKQDVEVKSIRFGDCVADTVTLKLCDQISISEDDEGIIMMEDVPNLIKALEMAMNLWGKSDE